MAEIAEAEGISRQGVRDALIRAHEELERMENALHFAELLQKQDALLAQAELTLQADNPDIEQSLQAIRNIQSIWEDEIGI